MSRYWKLNLQTPSQLWKQMYPVSDPSQTNIDNIQLDVDFAPPLDYVEPTPTPKVETPTTTITPSISIPTSVWFHTLQSLLFSPNVLQKDKGKAPEREEDKNKFVPFGGSGEFRYG